MSRENKNKMKKKFQNLTLLVFTLICFTSLGQNNMEDVVYLKNGSIIRGIIIEQVPNQSIKLQTKDRNVFVFKYDEIEKITKENLPFNNSNTSSNLTDFKKSGFINISEVSFCPGVGNVKFADYSVKNEDYSFGFRTINGYQVNEHLSLGVGLGIDKYKNVSMLPITFDARATFLKGKVSPVFTANIGYAINLDGEKGGLVINPQIGVKAYISKNIAYLFNIGYKWQGQEVLIPYGYDFYYGYTNKKENAFYQFITISTGFAF